MGYDLKMLDVFARLGLRMASLTHSRRNLLADGTQHGINTGGLTRVGRDAVRRCGELGIVIDTHEPGLLTSHLDVRPDLLAPNGYLHAGTVALAFVA